jgi:serine/threonine protein kinase
VCVMCRDMWAVGIVLFILLCGRQPFMGETHAILFDAIIDGRWFFTDLEEKVLSRGLGSSRGLVG